MADPLMLCAVLANRDRGAKVSEAAKVPGLSQPIVRAWIGSGMWN